MTDKIEKKTPLTEFGKLTFSLNTITTKLLMLFLFMTIIPLIALAQFSTDLISSNMTQRANGQLYLNYKISQNNYDQSQKNLRSIMVQAISTAIEEVLPSYTKENNVHILINRLKLLTKKSDLSYIYIVGKNKKLIASAYSNNHGQKIESFNNLVDKVLEKDDAFVTTEVLKERDLDIIGVKLKNQAEIELPDSKKTILTGLSQVVAMPIYNDKKENIGIVIGGKFLAKDFKLVDSIGDLTKSTVMYAQILENNKAVVVTTNLNTDKGIRAVGTMISESIVNSIYSNSIIPVREYQIRESQLANYYPLVDISGSVVGLVYIGVPEKEFTLLAEQNIRLLAFISVLGLFSAILLSALFSRSITTPILKLADAAKKISMGDLSIRINVKGSNEIAQMGESFNIMAENLQREERLRDDFVATLTHDLKVPLLAENQTITYMLKEAYGSINEEQKEVLEIIKNTNRLTLDMVNNLLEVYRYDAGKTILLKSDLDIKNIIKDSIVAVRALADEKNQELALEASDQPIMVSVDEREIKRVVHNLLANAISSTLKRGAIKIVAAVPRDKKFYYPENKEFQITTLKERVSTDNHVIVSVYDTGIGIEKEDMENLFKRFSGNKGRKPSSTGLGLYYSFQVIKAHDGFIWAESQEGVGSVFKFTLPLIKK